jgi:large subunit ribosomal protein L4
MGTAGDDYPCVEGYVSPVSTVHLHPTTIAPAAPIIQPVYLELSSLLIPGSDDPSPSSKVAILDPTVFDHPIRDDILHLCVVHHLDGLRQGSANTKTRAEVRGSGRKIQRQKGSGKARVGDAYSPIRRGGGVAFGPKPRDFSTKLPRKVIAMGMRVALSAKVKDERFGVVESLDWPGFKTKHLAKRIDELGWRKTLFVTGADKVPDGLARSSGNIPMVDTMTAQDLNVYTAVKWQRLVMDVAAVDYFERLLAQRPLLSES